MLTRICYVRILTSFSYRSGTNKADIQQTFGSLYSGNGEREHSVSRYGNGSLQKSVVISHLDLPSFPVPPPACSLSGRPSGQKWYFAVAACQGAAQVGHVFQIICQNYVNMFPQLRLFCGALYNVVDNKIIKGCIIRFTVQTIDA